MRSAKRSDSQQNPGRVHGVQPIRVSVQPCSLTLAKLYLTESPSRRRFPAAPGNSFPSFHRHLFYGFHGLPPFPLRTKRAARHDDFPRRRSLKWLGSDGRRLRAERRVWTMEDKNVAKARMRGREKLKQLTENSESRFGWKRSIVESMIYYDTIASITILLFYFQTSEMF